MQAGREGDKTRLPPRQTAPPVREVGNQAPLATEPTLAGLFEQQAARTPQVIAVRFGNQQWTYAQVNERANWLAHILRSKSVGPDTLVGVCLDRSLEMLLAVLAVHKAGGAYVPLDPAYPRERLAFMLADTQSPLLLVGKETEARLPPGPHEVLHLDAEADALNREPGDNLTPPSSSDRLAYVIYTSGSTGQPKGIAMGLQPLVNLLGWQLQNSSMSVGDKTLQFASLSFDVSFQEIYSTLCSGGTLVLLPEALRSDPMQLIRLLDREAVQRLFLPFIALQHLAEAANSLGDVLSHLREVITAGEQLQITPTIAEFFGHRPECVLQNQYGPSECHVVTAHTLEGSPSVWPGLPPIGRAIANTFVRLLDPNNKPVAPGEPGELHIGGVCLARGYLNRPDLTSARFLVDPCGGDPPGRLYRTGDLARLLPDGNLEFLGRIDHQVKIRGFRVELGEIEATLSQHPAVREAVVAARAYPSGERRLVAYLVSAPHPAPSGGEFCRFLRGRLPGYMIPSNFVCLDSLPLTPSGKVDRGALPPPPDGRPDLEQDYVAPRTDRESQLVALCERILKVRPVGVKDSFFELGGDSLLVADLLLQIRKEFGKELSLLDVVDVLTVEHLAALLDTSRLPMPSSALVAIQPHGARPPLFFVHPLSGDVAGYSPLARYLSPDQPSYGLQVPVVNGTRQPFSSLEAMAAHYVEALLAFQPTGPILLGGFSLGGVVAFEMAQQLLARGRRPALLAIVDEQAPGITPARWGLGPLFRFVENLGYWLKDELARDSLGEFRLRALQKARAIWRNRVGQERTTADDGPPSPDMSGWFAGGRVSQDFLKFCAANYRMVLKYSPQVYAGTVTLFRGKAQPLFGSHEPDLGWGRMVAGGVVVKPLPGSHESLLVEPQVKVLAKQLQGVLNRASL